MQFFAFPRCVYLWRNFTNVWEGPRRQYACSKDAKEHFRYESNLSVINFHGKETDFFIINKKINK